MSLTKDDRLVLSEIDKIRFLQRLKQLQNLCSGSNPNYPRVILCVPGPDGRGNKGSLMILKYLFQFSVGKELFEGNLDDRFECLEEMILLIQEHSVSVVVTVESKVALSPFLSICPLIAVYSSPGDVTEEVDEFQARKAATFKKLMLQAVPQGGVVGLSVPLGYDSVLDVENWSLMRAFAMESVVTGVGFFTARFTVIDVSEELEILFRAVDSSVVSKVIEIIKNSIVPNVHQSLRVLSGRGAVENRMKITSEDILSPLDFLFEFGELETVYPPDPLLKPIALFAQLSNALGNMPDHVKLAAPWKGAVMPAGGVHVVIEGCEPSTGVRWCRTYFTQRGRQVSLINDPDSLVSSGVVSGEETPAMAADIKRLETIYIVLWEGLRAAVREVFGGTGSELIPAVDVVSAGCGIEKFINEFVKSNVPGGLKSKEVLQIHIDCMNGLGQLCKVEDVDDIGGQCLAYLRISVHDIETSGLNQPVAVAVGDTFLFSPHAAQIRALLHSAPAPVNCDSSFLKHIQDSFCLTNAIPYMLGIFGIGVEDTAAQRLMHSLGSTHLLSLMGLGSPVEAHGSSSAYTFPLLTDHSSNPYFQQAELSFFDGGFVFERLNGASLPGVINFETHVECLWTVDMYDFLNEAQAHFLGSVAGASRNWLALPEGLVVIMKLRDWPSDQNGVESKTDDDKGAAIAMLNVNPFDAFLPEFSKVRHVAFVVRSDIQASAGYYSRTAAKWKRSIRTNDIPDYRGIGGASASLPVGILSSFLALYDYWGVMSGSGSSGAQDVMAASNIPQNLYDEDNECTVEDIYLSACGPLTIPGAGFLPLKSLFTVCENARVYIAEAEMIKSGDRQPGDVNYEPLKRKSAKIVVVIGHACSTALEVATALLPRLPNGSAHAIADYSEWSSRDLSDISAEVGNRIRTAAENLTSSGCVLLSLLISDGLAADLLLLLEQCIQSASSKSDFNLEVKFVLTVVASYHMEAVPALPTDCSCEKYHLSNNRLGSEFFSASVLSLCRFGISDLILCTDSTVHGSGFAALRRHVRALAGSTVGSNTFEGELSIFRLKPPVLRLEDEVIALLLSKISNEGCISRSYSRRVFEITNLTNISLSNPFTKIVEIELSDEGEKLAQWLVPRRLEIFSSPDIILRRTVKLQTIPTWRDVSKDRDFEMLTRCLRALFPKATFTSTSAAPDVWDIPVPDNFHPVGSIRRAMQMATTKVVVGKQLQVNRDRMEEYLSRSVEPIMLKRIHGVLRSISGHIELPGGTLLADSTKCALFGRKVALIDACAEFISIRIVDNFGYDSKLVACGNMDSDEFNFVDNLLSLCYLHRLERRSHITYSDLTDHEILKVQKESSHVELPGGCWYDGNVYLDVSGSRSRLRPDIRILAEGYIAKRNAQFDIYNRLISDGMGDTF